MVWPDYGVVGMVKVMVAYWWSWSPLWWQMHFGGRDMAWYWQCLAGGTGNVASASPRWPGVVVVWPVMVLLDMVLLHW